MKEDKLIDLDKKISLIGFSDENDATMVIVKKMVDNHVRKVIDGTFKFQSIAVSMKKIHQHADSKGGKVEIHVKLNDGGKLYTASVVDFDLYVAIDSVFKKIATELKMF
jgi:ribosome-associated translation inhibitor RaiA